MAGTGAALLPRRLTAAEPPPGITTVRLVRIPVICFAPQYVCEELLRAEGFTNILYVDADPLAYSQDLGRGKYDFATNVTPANIAAIDAGAPITILSGVHAGCYELFAHDGIRGIADLILLPRGCQRRRIRSDRLVIRRMSVYDRAWELIKPSPPPGRN